MHIDTFGSVEVIGGHAGMDPKKKGMQQRIMYIYKRSRRLTYLFNRHNHGDNIVHY